MRKSNEKEGDSRGTQSIRLSLFFTTHFTPPVSRVLMPSDRYLLAIFLLTYIPIQVDKIIMPMISKEERTDNKLESWELGGTAKHNFVVLT